MTDLIRRADAMAYPLSWAHYDKENGSREFICGVESYREYIENLPSAELTLQTPQTYGKSINPSNAEVVADYISRADAIECCQCHGSLACINRIKALPSAEAEDRLYIKIYADDEPSVKAEKLYQICGDTQNREVAEWLKEYFLSAEAVQGWIPCSERMPKAEDMYQPPEHRYLCQLEAYGVRKFCVLSRLKGAVSPFWDWYGIAFHDSEVTAWMPLPGPYKGGEDK